MKKSFAVSLAVVTLPSMLLGAAKASAAAGNHPMAGCGLGYVLFAHQDNAKVTQIFGGTTNATLGNQTFGISSGTSGCTEDGAVKFAKEAEVYAEVNLDSLRREMAVGSGDYVDTFASLLGASEKARPELVKFFHKEYASLFPTPDTTSAQLLAVLQSKLASRRELIG
jgi:hypothetical protein